MKPTLLLILATLFLSTGCVMKQTKLDRMGNVKEEKYIIKRPVKDFIENVEVE